MISISFLLAVLIACTPPVDTTRPPTVISSPGINKTLMLQLVNDARKKGCNCGDTYYPPSPAVTWNDLLEKAAVAHSNDMLENKYFSHTNKEGKSAGVRIKEAGYKWSTYGENIGDGFGSEKAAIENWLSSPGHCTNIMSLIFKEIGVARSGSYWTMVVAAK